MTIKRLSNVIIAILVVAYALVLFAPSFSAGLRAQAAKEVKAGQKLKAKGARPALLIFLNPTCVECEAAIPFIKKATAAYRAKDLQVVVFFSENNASVEDFLKQMKFKKGEKVPAFVVAPAFVAGTVSKLPAFILAEKDGTVIQAWTSPVDSEKEIQILKAAEGRPAK